MLDSDGSTLFTNVKILSGGAGGALVLDHSAINSALRRTLLRNLAFATAAPNNWGYVATEVSTNACPAIWLKVA